MHFGGQPTVPVLVAQLKLPRLQGHGFGPQLRQLRRVNRDPCIRRARLIHPGNAVRKLAICRRDSLDFLLLSVERNFILADIGTDAVRGKIARRANAASRTKPDAPPPARPPAPDRQTRPGSHPPRTADCPPTARPLNKRNQRAAKRARIFRRS
jgi:hypothetical protein